VWHYLSPFQYLSGSAPLASLSSAFT
jgi:hypothetical protein